MGSLDGATYRGVWRRERRLAADRGGRAMMRGRDVMSKSPAFASATMLVTMLPRRDCASTSKAVDLQDVLPMGRRGKRRSRRSSHLVRRSRSASPAVCRPPHTSDGRSSSSGPLQAESGRARSGEGNAEETEIETRRSFLSVSAVHSSARSSGELNGDRGGRGDAY